MPPPFYLFSLSVFLFSSLCLSFAVPPLPPPHSLLFSLSVFLYSLSPLFTRFLHLCNLQELIYISHSVIINNILLQSRREENQQCGRNNLFTFTRELCVCVHVFENGAVERERERVRTPLAFDHIYFPVNTIAHKPGHDTTLSLLFLYRQNKHTFNQSEYSLKSESY